MNKNKSIMSNNKIDTTDKVNTVQTLMVQGTTSDAGKSVLVAGICRVLKRRGLNVAPFKPQNMALNSAVTVDGGEIGRAQALQAQACGLEPHTDMNPILLKPSSDTGAQVIVHGKAINAMEAEAFHDYKKVAMAAVLESYKRLQEQYDFIIVEGAGSPAEINLRENDIANMGFAEAVDCPVIIVADIDRGGVFAHIVGTLDCLSSSEQSRVTGFMINRFRGDIALLEPGLDWLEQKTNKPVWGVIPYLKQFYLDAEDAITLQECEENEEATLFNIAIPVFSRISNHTDFDALQLHPKVRVNFIPPGEPFPNVDLIILPGTKNVRQDLYLMKRYGWDTAVKKHLRYGGKVIGICGGYQMLGEEIIDSQGIEDEPGRSQGLALFNMTTQLEPEKILENTKGRVLINKHGCIEGSENKRPIENTMAVQGYEIHCGLTQHNAHYQPFIDLGNGRYDGIISHDNDIIGTYFHGLFDCADASNAILAWAGLNETGAINLNEVREQQLDRLADCLDENLNSDFFNNLIQPHNNKSINESI